MSRRSSTSTPGRGLVEKQNLRLMAQRLGDQHPALHAARQLPNPRIALIPQRQLPQDLSINASSRGFPNRPRENRTVLITFSKGSSATSCGTRADH